MLERIFQLLAVLLLLIAGYFFWSDNFDAVFITSVLGAASFILSLRFQAKSRVALIPASPPEEDSENEREGKAH